jgi:hypothetical protein
MLLFLRSLSALKHVPLAPQIKIIKNNQVDDASLQALDFLKTHFYFKSFQVSIRT